MTFCSSLFFFVIVPSHCIALFDGDFDCNAMYTLFNVHRITRIYLNKKRKKYAKMMNDLSGEKD